MRWPAREARGLRSSTEPLESCASSGCAGQPHCFPHWRLLAVIRLVEHRLAEALPVPAWDDVEAHTSGHLHVLGLFL